MDKRLKIITIILGVIYAVILIKYTVVFGQGFRVGFNEGFERTRHETRGAHVHMTRTLNLSLNSEKNLDLSPVAVPMEANIQSMSVRVSYNREDVPQGLLRAENLTLFLIFVSLFVAIFVPILVFRIVHSITKSKFFDPINIKRLRKVGYALLMLYVAYLVINYINYKIGTYIICLDTYSLQMDWGNVILALLGLVVLMFAEVLKISVRLKEEQDLTV